MAESNTDEPLHDATATAMRRRSAYRAARLHRVMVLRRMIMEPIILLWFAFFLIMAFIMKRSMGEEG